MEKNLYKTAKNHKFVKALKKYVEKEGESFDEFLQYRYMARLGLPELDKVMKKQSVIIETIALYLQAKHATPERLDQMIKKIK